MTAFALKIIASVCMLIDHIGAVFAGSVPSFFRKIGRIAFPIYAYMIAQGCRHTKNINKYLLRLGIFALISEIPFDIAFWQGDINFLANTNVFYTLFFGAACIAVYEKIKYRQRPWICLIALSIIPVSVVLGFMFQGSIGARTILTVGFALYFLIVLYLCRRSPITDATTTPALPKKAIALLSALPIIFFGALLSTDYGMWGVLFILFFYLMKPENKLLRTIAMVSVVFLEYGYPYLHGLVGSAGILLPLLPGKVMNYTVNGFISFWFALIAAVLIWFYNGKQGPKQVKWAFYAFYPIHLAALAAIWFVLAMV